MLFQKCMTNNKTQYKAPQSDGSKIGCVYEIQYLNTKKTKYKTGRVLNVLQIVRKNFKCTVIIGNVS